MLGREQQHGSRQESNKRKRHLFHRKFRQHRRLDIGRVGLGNELRHYQFRHRFKQHRFGTPGRLAELLIHHVGAPGHPFEDAHFFASGSSWRLSGPKSDQRGPFEERPTSRKPWPDTHVAEGARYSTQLTNRHTVAAKVAMVVIQPRTLVKRLFTRSPITAGSLVMSIIRRSRGGTEKP
jgi:hypothetical protein